MTQSDGLKRVRPVLLLALVLPLVSQAQTPQTEALDAPLEPIEARRAQPRLRIGLGGGGGALITDSLSGYKTAFGGVGFAFEAGVQLADRFAIYARAAAETLILNTTAYGAVLGEVGVDRFSIATGLGLMASISTPIFGSTTSATLLSIPIVLGITPAERLDTTVARKGFHVWLEGAFAIPISGRGTLGGYGGLKLGYLWG